MHSIALTAALAALWLFASVIVTIVAGAFLAVGARADEGWGGDIHDAGDNNLDHRESHGKCTDFTAPVQP